MIAGLGILAYVTRAGLGSGGDLSCTILYLGLMQMVRLGVPIGEVLHVLLDNTAADNKVLICCSACKCFVLVVCCCVVDKTIPKTTLHANGAQNNTMIFFLGFLVLRDHVEEAGFFCMQVGHTYSRIDQSFRTLIRHMMSRPIYTVTEMLSSIAVYLSAYGSLGCFELHCMWSWSAFFAPHVHERFTGFDTGQFGSGMHQFMVRKDPHGVVRLWVRPSSQASSWLPEGEGMPIFKSEPSGHPELKNAKPDVEWRRAAVEATVNAWMSYMPVSPNVLASIKDNWRARFSCLPPPNGDITQIPVSQQLEWADLPRRTPGTFCPPCPVAGLSLGLEIPDVMPMTYHGRTTADREYELRQHQQIVMAHNARAVFQAQFLFVKGTSGAVELQRVANGISIADAQADDIVFSTAVLEHHPQEGLHGFWGHFSPKPNPAFDASDSKTGTKFIRQQEVRRADILVYNVQIFDAPAPAGHAKKKVVRVKVESLRALAEVSNEQPPVPTDDAQLPVTHGGLGGTQPYAGTAAPWWTARCKKLTVSELRQQLDARGLDNTGHKSELCKRLVEAGPDAEEEAGEEQEAEEQEAHGNSGDGSGNDDGDGHDGDGGDDSDDSDDSGGSEDDGGGKNDKDSADDDPPPPIPEGWAVVEFGQPFMQFLLWTQLTKTEPPRWRRWIVLKELPAGRRKFTHDAHLYDEPSTKKRGVQLSKDAHSDGLWVGIKQMGVASIMPVAMPPPPGPPRPPPPPPPRRPPAKRRAPAAAGKRSSRNKKQCQPFRPGDNSDGLAAYAREGEKGK